MRRVIGMDIHRTFAEVVFWEEGKLRPAGRISMTRAGLEGFGRSLGKEDEVVIEATGNAMAVASARIVRNPSSIARLDTPLAFARSGDTELSRSGRNSAAVTAIEKALIAATGARSLLPTPSTSPKRRAYTSCEYSLVMLRNSAPSPSSVMRHSAVATS